VGLARTKMGAFRLGRPDPLIDQSIDEVVREFAATVRYNDAPVVLDRTFGRWVLCRQVDERPVLGVWKGERNGVPFLEIRTGRIVGHGLRMAEVDQLRLSLEQRTGLHIEVQKTLST